MCQLLFGQQIFCSVKHIMWHDRFMCIRYIKPRFLAAVDLLFERQRVGGISFLEHLIPCIPFICEDILHSHIGPDRHAAQLGNALALQLASDLSNAHPGQKLIIDPSDDCCFLRLRAQASLCIQTISIRRLGQSECSVFHPHDGASAQVLRD